jgi:hypothetical protein
MAQARSEYIQDQRNTSQTQAQYPTNGCQLAQPLRLIRAIYAFRVVPKSSTASPATITKHLHMANLLIFDRFVYPTPPLQDFTLAVGAMMRSFLGFALDFWKAKNDN